ncbi:MAG: ATP-binding cassette domain-containing protein, partial [Thermoplasmata archaeon]
GRIVRDGVEITDWSPEERGLGYVPQGLGLFPHRTVERNVAFPLEVRGRLDARARGRELLERFRLTPLRDRYPARLSGGELQRVALARALAAEPELIVWDEPWQALDVEARYELGRVLQELRGTERVPVLVVTHDPALAFSVADTFVVLHRGQVRAQGDATTLLDRPSDAFTARFVGFENVYDRAELEAAPTTFAAWLVQRAGSEGVAFPRPTVAGPNGAVPWEGTVESARPTPEGVTVVLRVGPTSVVVRLARPWTSPFPSAGDRLGFAVEEETLHPLGGRFLSPPGAG